MRRLCDNVKAMSLLLKYVTHTIPRSGSRIKGSKDQVIHRGFTGKNPKQEEKEVIPLVIKALLLRCGPLEPDKSMSKRKNLEQRT